MDGMAPAAVADLLAAAAQRGPWGMSCHLVAARAAWHASMSGADVAGSAVGVTGLTVQGRCVATGFEKRPCLGEVAIGADARLADVRGPRDPGDEQE